jgi:tRNA A-37 threonylcarbamoyl transferase component Bud32/dienelactone hydrolase
MIGRTLSHYQILEKIGEGGMGVVYKARDAELGRLVALKLLSGDSHADTDRRRRFLHEARAASALNHPNIITIYEIGHADGLDFIVMEYVDGRPLNAVIPSQGLPLKDTVALATQIASALGRAHDAGIVHRDLKPANILVTGTGTVKVVDFGLAKLAAAASASGGDEKTPTQSIVLSSQQTRDGLILGTVGYMSPEQAEGKAIDARSDVFSFGVLLYEMLVGQRPFRGDSDLSTLMAIVRDPAPPLPAEVPTEMTGIVRRALEKDRALRYRSAADVASDLAILQQGLSTGSVRPVRLAAKVKRPQIAIPALALLLILVVGSGWFIRRQMRIRWARQTAIPEAVRLMTEGKAFEAFDLAAETRAVIPNDPELIKIWPEVSATPDLTTEPEGADVYIRQYNRPEQPWRYAGKSPLRGVALPRAFLLVKATTAGVEPTTIAAASWFSRIDMRLHPQGSEHPGMVYVPATPTLGFQVGGLPQLRPPPEPYFIDRYEVSNREYKRFVDAGAYQNKDHWKQPFHKEGRTLTWEEAMREFRDSTGRPGPSTWEAGTYPPGQEDFPVAGVSWYEAAAYAEFSGKSLPTLSHWCWAADFKAAPYIIPLSNFNGKGPAPIRQFQGATPVGAYDMAGNVKEWVWNEGRQGLRFIPGGAWGSPTYQFTQPEAIPALDRAATNGFRCVRYTKPPADSLTQAFANQIHDYSEEKPVSDEVFQAYRLLYVYNRTELKPVVEPSPDGAPDWRREKITINAAYGGERLPIFLFLPINTPPPYQVIVYHPGLGAVGRSSEGVLDNISRFDFIVRSGRAVAYPVFKGTYERRIPTGARNELLFRDIMVARVQDLNRTVDYLATRSDVDLSRIAYGGSSAGAAVGPVLIALEPRLKAAVLQEGGLPTRAQTPVASSFHFAPRVKIPVLMLNGRYDYTFPVEQSQKPLFHALGTPEKQKRHVIYDTAHDVNVFRTEMVRETLNFLDEYLGPVRR